MDVSGRPPAERALVLCADDYGMNPGVNRAILDGMTDAAGRFAGLTVFAGSRTMRNRSPGSCGRASAG